MEKVEKQANGRKKQMSKNIKILILLTILFAGAALAIFVTTYKANEQSSSPFTFFPRVYRSNPADLDLYYVARTVFSTVNIVLLIVLIINYLSIYLKTKSEFTIGLLLFAVFFLIKDIAWSPFIVVFAGFNLFGLGPFAFLPDLFEMIALSVLLYLSVKY
jgi:hypothetical protein